MVTLALAVGLKLLLDLLKADTTVLPLSEIIVLGK
jgi:hypothetical protein